MAKTSARLKTTEGVLSNGSRLAVGGWWLLMVDGWRGLAVGGWRLVVPRGCPLGLSLTKKKMPTTSGYRIFHNHSLPCSVAVLARAPCYDKHKGHPGKRP